MSSGGRTYEAAGVSLAAAEAVVDRLRAAVESTGAEGFGAFAGLYQLDERRFLAATTDGVGSKLVLSRLLELDQWDGQLVLGGTTVRFLPEGPRGRPELYAELFD